MAHYPVSWVELANNYSISKVHKPRPTQQIQIKATLAGAGALIAKPL
jgi:hypothetical protein